MSLLAKRSRQEARDHKTHKHDSKNHRQQLRGDTGPRARLALIIVFAVLQALAAVMFFTWRSMY